MLKQIFINTCSILHNRKTGDRRPVITVRTEGGRLLGRSNTVRILHEGREIARIVYRPDTPLPSGPTCWVETSADVEVAEAPELAPVPVPEALSDPDASCGALAGT